MNKVLAAKQFIKFTKLETKEQERKEQIISLFKGLFGFEPEEVNWSKITKTLTAIGKVSVEDFILGEEVCEITFYIEEDPLAENQLNWELSSFSKGIYTCYKWKTKMKGYKVFVEILTK